MGKRKRTQDHINTTHPSLSFSSPDNMPCSSGVELSSRKKSSHFLDSKELKPFMSSVDVDSSFNHSSLVHHRHNLGRSMLLKRSRHWYGHQNSWRNSDAHVSASTSQGKTPPSWDERLAFRFASRYNSDNWHYADFRDRAFSRPERIRLDPSAMDLAARDIVKMPPCGICKKLLRRNHHLLAGSHSFVENSVVAVLVCGHVYHSDCLEQKTPLEDKCDPPCPICLDLLSPADAFAGGGGE